jgi:ABC-type multidrug transport system fused ATPase/permease subunit
MGIVQNVFKNTFIIKIYEYFPNIQKWIEESFNIYASKYRRTWIIGIPGMIMAMILSLLPMTLLVIGCYFGVRDNFMQIGGLVAILIITSPLYNQLRTVFDTILRTRSRAESANRMMTLWEAPLESRKETAGVTLIEDKEPLLRLDNISFKYNNDYILDGLNITINKRDHIVIFGENGSGKSTLLNIIMNIYDIEKGAIYLKGINYMDIDKDIYRSKFSFVPQNNYIFSGPLVDNLKQGKNNATESEITYAIHEANLEGFISDLKEGLLTHTNEAGTCFSGGEKQRIAIARALIKDAEIVLLDEISSFLDDQTADSILNIINEKFADKTVIQISHDQNKIIKANRIITLVNGKAVEITN